MEEVLLMSVLLLNVAADLRLWEDEVNIILQFMTVLFNIAQAVC